jgi:hypothetical protein
MYPVTPFGVAYPFVGPYGTDDVPTPTDESGFRPSANPAWAIGIGLPSGGLPSSIAQLIE